MRVSLIRRVFYPCWKGREVGRRLVVEMTNHSFLGLGSWGVLLEGWEMACFRSSVLEGVSRHVSRRALYLAELVQFSSRKEHTLLGARGVEVSTCTVHEDRWKTASRRYAPVEKKVRPIEETFLT